jgi:hypothetical protein
MTVGGSIPPDFATVNPTNDVTFTSPQASGTYTVVLTIGSTGGGDVYVICVDSDSTSQCVGRTGNGTITLVGVVTKVATHPSIHLYDGTCP